MALYEYVCAACGTSFTKRMPMADVVQSLPCTSCGKTARKAIGGFAVVGRAQAGAGDGPAPWDSDGAGDDDGGDGGGDMFGGHGHSHGPGGHSH